MNFKCTKCSADIDVDKTLANVDGAVVMCPECKSRLWVYKESFAGRALNKSGEIHCFHCASNLGNTIVCPGCKALYPDYIVVRSTKKVRRRTVKIQKSFIAYQTSSQPRKSRTPIAPRKEKAPSQRSFKVLGILLVLLALSSGGGYVYYQYQRAAQYSADYMRALYGIKTGTDTCGQVASALKKKIAAQRISAVSINPKDGSRLVGLKDRIDKLMSKIESPPSKFIKSDKQIKDLYKIYTSLNSVTLAAAGSPENFFKSTSKLQDDFSAGFKELRADLPPKLSESFKIAQVKYKALRDI
jgi:uncharacterized protein YbaR (Trm112 family)